MTPAIAIALTALLGAAAPQPSLTSLAAETIEALELPEVPKDASAPEWSRAAAKTFRAVPQRSVRLTDKTVNAALAYRKPVDVTVRAAYSRRELAVLVEWGDGEESRFSRTETNAFGDTVAIELPVRFGAGQRLPYVGMGDEGQHVIVYAQRAGEGPPWSGAFVSAGYGSLTRSKALTAKQAMAFDKGAKRWRALFVRPLTDAGHEVDRALVPIAFAVWDGAQSERSGNKLLTAWKFLRLGRHAVDANYVAEVGWGFDKGSLGDPAAGKAQFGTVCLACHRTNDYPFAPPDLAPDLTDVGAIAHPAYLRDSIQKPSDVLVRHVNPNRAWDPSKKPDPNGAYPNNEAFTWFSVDAKGAKVSKMPVLAHLTEKDVRDLVAYLRSLNGAPK